MLNALRTIWWVPALFQEFCNEFTREMNRLRMEGHASIDAAQLELVLIDN